MRAVSSRQNPIVARYRAAMRGELPDTLLLDGAHLVDEALAAGLRLEHALVASTVLDRHELGAIVARLDRASVEVASATSQVMAAVSPVHSPSPIVALAGRPVQPHTLFDRQGGLVVIVADLQDPGNVGAIIRVAEAAGADGVVVAGASADPFGWKALRGSMGSALRVPLIITPRLQEVLDAARRSQTTIVATVPRGGAPLFDTVLAGSLALLIGGEGIGLPEEVASAADVKITIPMEPPVESLNAAVAAAVLLFEARRQRSEPTASGARHRQRA